MDFLHLIAKETQAEGFVRRIGENVYYGTTQRKLARCRHKVHLLEALFLQARADAFIGNFLPFLNAEQRILQFLGRRYLLFQGLWIGDNEKLFGCLPLEQFAYSRRPLHAQGRFVIAALYAFAQFRQKKHAVPLSHII